MKEFKAAQLVKVVKKPQSTNTPTLKELGPKPISILLCYKNSNIKLQDF